MSFSCQNLLDTCPFSSPLFVPTSSANLARKSHSCSPGQTLTIDKRTTDSGERSQATRCIASRTPPSVFHVRSSNGVHAFSECVLVRPSSSVLTSETAALVACRRVIPFYTHAPPAPRKPHPRKRRHPSSLAPQTRRDIHMLFIPTEGKGPKTSGSSPRAPRPSPPPTASTAAALPSGRLRPCRGR